MEYGLIGERLSHSFSKTIHNMLYKQSYDLVELKRDELRDFFEKKDFKAINVTIPYKSEVMQYLDEIAEEAQKIGAVNTVVNKNGRLYGYNTDFYGMRELFLKNEISPSGKKCAILGSGGTSKTAREVLLSLGADAVLFVSRSKKNGAIDYKELKELHGDTQIIVNTTPLGMYPDIDSSPIDFEGFDELCGVVDVVYNPLRTSLVLDAKARKVNAVGGLYMLVSQAVFAAELFLDTSFQKETTDDIYRKLLSEKQNIVLCGMAGCGKSTVAKIISEKLNMDFYDTDELIEKREGRSIPDIFKCSGEEYFRRVEKEVISSLGGKNNSVISLGGGAVMFSENVANMKKNGRIVFYERAIEDIVPTDNRPLCSNRADLEALYKKRYPTYKGVCDIHVVCSLDAEAGADAVIERYFNECSY